MIQSFFSASLLASSASKRAFLGEGEKNFACVCGDGEGFKKIEEMYGAI